MSIINLSAKLQDAKKANKDNNKMFGDLQIIRDQISKMKDDQREHEKQIDINLSQLKIQMNELKQIDTMQGELELLCEKVEEIDKKLESKVDTSLLKENLDEVSTCLEDFVISSTPRIDYGSKIFEFEAKLSDLQNQYEKLATCDLKHEPQFPSVEFLEDDNSQKVQHDVPTIIFKRPVKKDKK